MISQASTEKKPVIFSGVQPSGELTIGNYLGAIKNWVSLQESHDCLYCVVDLHAITVPQTPADLRRRTLEVMAKYLAAGIDPAKATLFVQSHVPEHTQLSWVLSAMTYMGELSRMTQFKEKSRKNEENLNAGLFTYPVLMASDILLYQTQLVPVGEDQRQHLELARDLARRFNHRYSDTFPIPEGYMPKAGARIMSLQEPDKKMSKSDENPLGYLSMMEKEDQIVNKIKRSVTDSIGEVRYDKEQPGIYNLIGIYAAFSGESPQAIEERFAGAGYGVFKKELAEVIVSHIGPMRARYEDLLGNKDYLEQLIAQGAEKARVRAAKTLSKVYKKTGFVLPAGFGKGKN